MTSRPARLRKVSLVWIVVAVVLPAILFLKFQPFQPRVCFENHCLRVELARSHEERLRGLMFRKGLGEARGMLFVFPGDDFWTFWMKNTYIPLDIVWMDARRRVVDVRTAHPVSPDADPPVLKPSSPSRYVMEANAGFMRKHNVKIGDSARFDWIFFPEKI